MLQFMYRDTPFLHILRIAMSKAGNPVEIQQVFAKIWGVPYVPEEQDPEAPDHPSNDLGDDKPSVDSKIPCVVEFDCTTPMSDKSSSNALEGEDDSDDVSQISD